jgi:hypothetical protein
MTWSGSGITITSGVITSATQVRLDVSVASLASGGPRDLTLICGTTSATLAAAITVIADDAPPPPPQPGGGFTLEEKASLSRLYQAMQYVLAGALSQYTALVTSSYTDQSNNFLVGQGAGDIATTMEHLNSGLSGLLGVVTETHGTPPFDALAAKSRPEQVLNAYAHLDHALVFIDRAIGSWTAARTRKADATYQDSVGQIITVLEAARRELQAFDRTLAYLDFYPLPPTPGGFRTIVGPHGDYDAAMWKLWRSVAYYTRATASVASAVRRGFPTGQYTNAGRPYINLAQVSRNSIRAQMIYAFVLPMEMDRFFAVLDGLKLLTTDEHPGTPMALHFLAFEWHATFTPKFGRDGAWDEMVMDAVVITHDAWKHSDGAAWQTMVFPDCSILNNPAGCGGR